MTKEKLKAYRSAKEEIRELESRLKERWITDSEDFTGSSVINDYRSGYPVPQAVVGTDWGKYDRARKRYSNRLDKLEKECEEIEKFIEGIEDSLTRRIFRMYYIDGKTQKEIAQLVSMDRSMVSRKLNTPDLC